MCTNHGYRVVILHKIFLPKLQMFKALCVKINLKISIILISISDLPIIKNWILCSQNFVLTEYLISGVFLYLLIKGL